MRECLWMSAIKGWIKGGSKRRAFGSEVEKAKGTQIEKEDANPKGRYPK